MALFKFRKGGDEPAATRRQPESVEAMRQRARHRLIGAGVLVLIGVVGFPLLFDTQPRPIPVDIPIEIPGKSTVKPLVVPAAPAATAPAATPTPTPSPTPAEKVAANASLAPREEILPSRPAVAASAPAAVKNDVKPEPKPEAKPAAKPEPKPEPKPEAKPAAKPAVANADAARASALLNGTTPPPVAAAAEAEGRLVVQVGAFADVAKAREARLKLEKAGLKTYTQVAETKDGKRIRVRVGPFATKAEAEKAAGKIKSLDLPAAILTL